MLRWAGIIFLCATIIPLLLAAISTFDDLILDLVTNDSSNIPLEECGPFEYAMLGIVFMGFNAYCCIKSCYNIIQGYLYQENW